MQERRFCRALIVAIGEFLFPGQPRGWRLHVARCANCRRLVEDYEIVKNVARKAGAQETSPDEQAVKVPRFRRRRRKGLTR
jgi:hypothetical protein